MEVIELRTLTLTQQQVNRLKKLPLESEISNKESIIYQTDTLPKHKIERNTLFKYLHIKDKESMANKLYTVSMLSDYEATLNIKELVIPRQLVSVNGQAVGFTVPQIKDATNLGVILHDPKIPKEKKLELLRKVGELLNKTENLEKYGIHFYFNDLHEYNFLIDNKTEDLYAIDLDSAALNSEYPLASYYMYSNPNLGVAPNKYKANVFGLTYPDHNSDLFCYNMIVLDTIAGYQVSLLPLEEFYEYTSYLRDLGFGQNLIDAFNSVYTPADNKNVANFLDEVPTSMLGQALYNVFKIRKNKAK